jgi:endonuclease/exonuclease/phosphatase family metal-dependent hydrolase
MWVKAVDWYGAWEKLLPRFAGDLLIGDLNIDPSRQRKRDQKPLAMLQGAGWRWGPAEGTWSYRSYSGVTSAVDHVFVGGDVEVRSARYVVDGIVGVGPVDHTALVVEASPPPLSQPEDHTA